MKKTWTADPQAHEMFSITLWEIGVEGYFRQEFPAALYFNCMMPIPVGKTTTQLVTIGWPDKNGVFGPQSRLASSFVRLFHSFFAKPKNREPVKVVDYAMKQVRRAIVRARKDAEAQGLARWPPAVWQDN